jgi:hypothetical protein
MRFNFFKLPVSDLELTGPKDIYDYFNAINNMCEKPSLFYDPVLDEEILRTEPLEYKFYTQSFFYWGKGKAGRPTITVRLEKTNGGTCFYIQPKAGIALWIFALISILQLLLSLYMVDYKVFIATFICLVIVYCFERYQIRTLIDNFKKELL